MANYAQLSPDNIVLSVFVGRDENDLAEGVTDWELYYAPTGFTVKRTSRNTFGGEHLAGGEPFRFNYGEIGFTYDADRDAFIPPQPYPSWVLDEATCLWVAPIDYPADGGQYEWDEPTTSWIEYEQSS